MKYLLQSLLRFGNKEDGYGVLSRGTLTVEKPDELEKEEENDEDENVESIQKGD